MDRWIVSSFQRAQILRRSNGPLVLHGIRRELAVAKENPGQGKGLGFICATRGRGRGRGRKGAMGKGKDPWDDSALVDAFDRAVASFKEAHFQKGGAVSAEQEEGLDGAKPADGTEGDGEGGEVDSANRNVSDEHTNQDDKVESKEEIQDEETTIKQNDDAKKSYDELLKQFYELEEKRQAVLQQIYAHPDYYDQTTQPDACNAAAPEHASQDPQCLNSACVGYCLPVSVVPVTGGNSCAACNSCFSICQPCDKCPDNYAGCNVAVPCTTNSTKQSHDMDHSSDLKKGIMVAESAMRVINSNISGKESETVSINESLQAIGISDADLLPVLNAWYSAGFQTARYLMGKSQQNNTS